VEVPTGRDNNVAEAEEVSIVFVFFGEQVGDVRGAREMGNENFRGALSIPDSHIADIDVAHFLVSAVMGPLDGTFIVIP